MIDLRHLPNPVPNEKIIHVLRRHPITLFTLGVGLTLIIIGPFAVWYGLAMLKPQLLADQITFALILMGGSAFWLFAWLFIFQHFIDYYLDIWILTTKRVLNIEQTGLFARTVSELRLYRIQDVTSVVNGFFHTMLDFGDVEIQTAGEKTRFKFEEISHPTRVSKSILEYAEIDRKEHLDEAVEQFGMPDKENLEPRTSGI
ncbi:MAG: PH domain-containing protein [Patescibacteria group bacterium]